MMREFFGGTQLWERAEKLKAEKLMREKLLEDKRRREEEQKEKEEREHRERTELYNRRKREWLEAYHRK